MSTAFYVPTYSNRDIPTGFQRADGVDVIYGTGNKPESLAKIKSASVSGESTIALEETPDSPVLERAEQMTATHKYTMSWSAAVTALARLHRGQLYRAAATAVEDPFTSGVDETSIFKVLSAKITHGAGNVGTLEITSEALNVDVPPDQFNISTIELGVNILKHPRYYYALSAMDRATGVINVGDNAINQQVIRLLQQYFDNPNLNARNSWGEMLASSIDHPGTYNSGTGIVTPATSGNTTFLTGTNFAKYAAMEIIQKYWLGIETPYVVGWQIVYSTYYWKPPTLNPGGIIQEPYQLVDEQFLWRDIMTTPIGSVDDTIFWGMASANPTCYSSDGTSDGQTRISWLRKADTMTFERTFYRVDSTWIGSPIGHWDYQLFGSQEAPTAGTARDAYSYCQPLWLPELTTRP